MKGPTLDPLAPAQSKHRFSPPAWALKLLCFLTILKSVKKTSKIELENNILESLRFFLFRLCFWQPFAHVMDRFFVPLGRYAIKKSGFS